MSRIRDERMENVGRKNQTENDHLVDPGIDGSSCRN